VFGFPFVAIVASVERHQSTRHLNPTDNEISKLSRDLLYAVGMPRERAASAFPARLLKLGENIEMSEDEERRGSLEQMNVLYSR